MKEAQELEVTALKGSWPEVREKLYAYQAEGWQVVAMSYEDEGVGVALTRRVPIQDTESPSQSSADQLTA